MRNNSKDAFFTLLRAGLWADADVNLNANPDENVDWEEVYQLAEEQSVIGLVLAGVERYKNLNDNANLNDNGGGSQLGLGSTLRLELPSQMELLQWIGEVQMLEQQNKEMNRFIAELIEKMRNADIYALLVKGQGIAQCYERPLWRACGDVDLLLSNDNYQKAKSALIPIASEVANENTTTKHQALVINGFDVELHGKMPFTLSMRVEAGIDEVLDDLFCWGNVRSWDCNGTQVFLPSPDNDVILVFTHFLHHFFIEGVGIRQICDWCRLLFTYKDSLNYELLESRIRKMGLMSEWKAFGFLAVNTLGMPRDAMPFYDSRYKAKGERVLERIMKSGNMGHNNDLSYREKYSGLTYKIVALWRRIKDFAGFMKIFPIDAPKFFVHYVFRKI